MVPAPTEPLDRNLFASESATEEQNEAVIAPVQRVAKEVVKSVGPVHELEDPFEREDFDDVAKILTRLYSGSRNCPTLGHLLQLIKKHPLPGQIVVKIIDAVTLPDGIRLP